MSQCGFYTSLVRYTSDFTAVALTDAFVLQIEHHRYLQAAAAAAHLGQHLSHVGNKSPDCATALIQLIPIESSRLLCEGFAL